jgi:hypothetical protein
MSKFLKWLGASLKMPRIDIERATPELVCMRLKDMTRIHPHQISSHCSRCGEEIGIFPSGQRIMKQYPGIKLVCQECRGHYDVTYLAPGALTEPFESEEKK